MHFVMEAIIVGVATTFIGVVLSVGAMYTQPDFKIQDIDFWESLLIVNFLIGFIIHIICEFSGINLWYCKNGHACKK